MTRPQFVTDELARREQEARDAYATIKGEVPEELLISEDEYVRRYLAAMEPVTTGGAA
ncbi:MAG: hypothetical protein ABFD89_09125 [Bryobacteraceae bacterium]